MTRIRRRSCYQTGRIVALHACVLAVLASPAAAQLPPGVGDAIATVLAALSPSPAATATPTPDPNATPSGTVTPGTTPSGSPTGTVTGTPTGTVTGTPTVNPNATPAPGGSIAVVSAADAHGVDGDALDGGQFRIHNSTDSPETVSAIRVQATDAAMLDSMTLTAGGQSVTVSDPSDENSFFFDPDLEIPPGGSIDVALSVTIGGSSSSTTASPTPDATITATPGGTVTPGGTTTPTATATVAPTSSIAGLTGRGPRDPEAPAPPKQGNGRGALPPSSMIAMLAVMLGYAGFRASSKRFAFVAVLVLVALYAGCGTEQTSAQTVTGITASNGSGPVTMTGLPGSLGTVSRPEPLVFPGASK